MERADFLTIIWDAYESGDLLPICAWCQRVRVEGEWVVAPRAALDTIDRAMTLSHSICPACTAAQPPPVTASTTPLSATPRSGLTANPPRAK